MSRWAEASSWSGDGLQREVFYFPAAGGRELYGSLYAGAVPSPDAPGVVACGSWGVEADRTDPLLRSVALAAARRGGAGLVFHYPGYGDSHGDLGEVELADLSAAAAAAAAEASLRRPGVEWILAGFALGASVACLAQAQAGVERLLLVQPALRPGAYFRRLTERTQPLAPGPSPREMLQADHTPGRAYGYPIPQRIVAHAAEADAAVAAALTAFEGEGAVIRQASASSGGEAEGADSVPERFQRIEAPGGWRFGAQNHPELAAACGAWLARATMEVAR